MIELCVKDKTLKCVLVLILKYIEILRYGGMKDQSWNLKQRNVEEEGKKDKMIENENEYWKRQELREEEKYDKIDLDAP